MRNPLRFRPLVWAALRRHRLRTLLTMLSVLVAFLLFGLLHAINHAFYGGVKAAGRRILVTTNAEGLVSPLPRAYAAEIAGIKNVRHVAYEVWMGGYYQHHSQILVALAVSPRRWLAEEHRNLTVAPGALRLWLSDREGALVGRNVARTYHWHVGEEIPFRSDIWLHPNGHNTWPIKIDGIFRSKRKALEEAVFLHYRYWNHGQDMSPNTVSLFRIQVDHLSEAGSVARAIDLRFANSPFPTRTASSRTFVKNFIEQTVDIGVVVQDILIAVFFTMLLVTANTLARSVRERSSEIAVLKTQGYSRQLIFGLIFAEGAVVIGVGGVLGILIAGFVVQVLHAELATFLPFLALSAHAVGWAFLLMFGFAVISSLLPALQVLRLETADALRRG